MIQMTLRQRTLSFFVASILFAIGIPKPFSQAQEGALDIATAYDTGVRAMENGKYDIGLQAVDDVISTYGSSGMADFGPVFGHFYYLKGMLHIKSKQYAAAIPPLKTCIEKFKNDKIKAANEDAPFLPNRFRVNAMFQWGNALMALKKFKEAADKFDETLKQTEAFEPYIPRLQCQINLAQCYINSDQVDKGKDFLVTLIDGDKVTDSVKRSLFMILANDWSIKVKFEELRPIIHKYRDLMYRESVIDRYRKRNRAFHGLASKSMEDEEPIRSLLWYSMMVHPGDVSKYYSDRILELDGRVKAEEAKPEKDRNPKYIEETKKQIKDLEPEIDSQRTQLSNMLLGIGAAHYVMGSLSGARSAYLELAEQFPQHKQRPVILHNLVITAVNLSLWKEGYKYGLRFFDEFPDHELKGSVARVLVEVIFLQAEYQEAYDISVNVREDMPVGDKDRDIPDFVTGGSLYHLGRFEEAEFELEAYLKNYPEPQRKEPAMFYIGGTKVNLQKWGEAAVSLDAFLEEFPNSSLRPTALYLAGLSHLVLEDYNHAYARIAELQAKHPQAEEVPASWNVKGDILSGQEEDFDKIVACYIEANRMWEEAKRGDKEVAGYSHRQLVTENSGAEKWEEAAKYFDHFKANYDDTSWKVDVNIAAVKPLSEVGRKDEAKAILEQFVNEFGANPGTTELDEMFGAYASFLGDNYTIEETRKAFQAFPSTITPPPPALRAWLIMGEIEAMEGSDPKGFADDIKQAFFRLNALYNSNGNDLSNYTLVRLARFNLKELGKKAEARKVYDFILNERPIGDAIAYALIDTAKMDAEADTAQAWQGALTKFNRVLNEIDNPKMFEEAVLGIARIYEKQEKWDEAQAEWEKYLENGGWRIARPEANFGYANGLEKRGKQAEALKAYVNVYANFPGHLDWSTQAYLRTAQIMRDRGSELDSLKVLQDMLKRMGHLEHPGVVEANANFQKWRAEYVAKNPAK
ncbi:MAG: tetratricopeptide repeat protein [Verrucomicrobiales bacterium]